MEMYPIIKERRVKKKIKEINVYCSCRRPLTRGAQFIQCGACREWYHTNPCVKVDKIPRTSGYVTSVSAERFLHAYHFVSFTHTILQ